MKIPLLEMTEMQQITDLFTEGMNEVAMETLGKEKKKKQPWMTNEIMEKCDERRRLKADKFKDEECNKKYRAANNLVRREMKKAKEEFVQKKCVEVTTAFERNDSRTAYRVVKELTNEKTATVSVIEDANGELLTEATKIEKRWTEYIQELYSYPIARSDDIATVLEREGPGQEECEPDILKSEIEEAVRSLKNGKAAGFDNIPSELLKFGGGDTIEILHKICNLVWKSGKWPTQMTKSLILPLAKKGDLKKCTNYRTISLISHPSKVLLKIINNRLKTKAEEILAEEQAGFRSGRSTVEQIVSVRILGEKYRDHQMEIHHNFIDFKKAFDRVWRKALWLVMKKHNVGAGLVNVIESLYNDNSNAVLTGSNGTMEWFQTTVGVRQGCILSLCLFNIFLEQIMTDALDNYSGTVRVSGRQITNLRFADDIDLIAGTKEELEELTKRLDTTARKYGMEISAEKSKTLVTSRIAAEVANGTIIKVDRTELEEVKTFQYLCSTLNEDVTSEHEIKKRLAIATNQLAKLNRLWNLNGISTAIKINLLKSLVTLIALYGCESWTYNKCLEKRIYAFELRCFRRVLGITWKQKITNVEVEQRIRLLIGNYEPLLVTARRRKLQWFGHITRQNGTLAHDIMHGAVEGSRGRGRPRNTWLSDIVNWTGKSVVSCMRVARDRGRWRKTVNSSKCPNGQRATGVT